MTRTRWLLCFGLFATMTATYAQRPPAVIPNRADAVIERLPRGYANLMPTLGAKASVDAIATIQQLLAVAARSGDARLAARADQLLSKFPIHDSSNEVLRARAFSAQHRHDFHAALQSLDMLITLQPRDGDARLMRAEIYLVQGRLNRARADCASLALGVDLGSGMLCAASLSLRTGEYRTAAAMIERWLAQASTGDQRRRYALVMRAEIAARADDPGAGVWFRRALALDAGDVRTLAAYARYLRDAGRDREIETLLADTPDHDGLKLQRALAAQRMGAANAGALIQAQARRYAIARAVGSAPELRDEAEFLLTLRRRPQAALALAQRNFETQRDYEDVDLLRRAAIAAHRPDALRPLQAWAAAQRLPLPSIAQVAQ